MRNDSKIAALNERHGLTGIARIEAGNGGLPKVRIETKSASADVYLYGAQVTSWVPAGFDEVLFLSEKSHWQEGKPIRGGIPVCFPWFRGKPDDKQAPTHGFVRTKEWTLNAIRREENDAVTVILSTESDAESRRWWPYRFRLEYAITVWKTLTLELKMQNTGDGELQFQEALHTYFRVGDVQRVTVKGLDGVRYLDNRDGNREKLQDGGLILTKQTDNAYLDATGAVEIVDPVLGRRLVTEKQKSVSTIVWNPWSNGAAALADFGDEEWQGMLCAEGGNVLGQPVHLDTGRSHTMSVSLTASRL
ncbi:MAG TPA: D-hexose-6-phosphate mutarotase [Terracidiphilus sp.]|nr:D-hexose-6-phosphate mutarotase [Terracidiphilus sp.]